MDHINPPGSPLFLTYWNPATDISNSGADWFAYLRGPLLAKYAANSFGQYVQRASAQQIQAVDTMGRKICGSLHVGFSALGKQIENLSSNLGAISSQLEEVSSELRGISNVLQSIDGRLTLMLDEVKTSNLLLENIGELLRIPDSQRQRQHHIEMALKFLKNSQKDEDLYQDALSELLAAEKLLPSDYFVLHRIGLVYLYVPALGNVEKAIEYFTKAGKYAAVENDPHAARLSNLLSRQVDKRIIEQSANTPMEVGALAAESYSQAAAALYALGRFAEAAKMAEKTLQLQPAVSKFRFFMAKYLARLGEAEAAVPHLQKAVELSPEMALAAVADFDLNMARPILDLLNRLDSEVTMQLQKAAEALRDWPRAKPEHYQDAKRFVSTIHTTIETGTYPKKISLAAGLEGTNQLKEIAALGIPRTQRWAWGLSRVTGIAISNDFIVYYVVENRGIYAIDARSSENLWNFQLDEIVNSAPVIGTNGSIIVTSGIGTVTALNGRTGVKLWRFNAEGKRLSLPAIGADGTIYLGLNSVGVIALNLETGKMLWKFESGTQFSAPAVDRNGNVYLGSSDKGLMALDGQCGQLLWNYDSKGHIVSEPSIGLDGTIYVGTSDRGVLALNHKTGAVLWNFKSNGLSSVAPAIDNEGTIFVGKPLLALDGQTGKLFWRNETASEGVAVGSDGVLYSGSGNKLVVLDARSGQMLWDFETPGPVASPTLGSDCTVWLRTFTGIYAIWTTSSWCARSPWPMSRQNSRNTGMSNEAAAHYIKTLPERVERARLAEEKKRQEEAEAEAEAKRLQDEILRLETEADAVVVAENTKWLRKKDFSRARALYQQAAALGSKKAAEKLNSLP